MKESRKTLFKLATTTLAFLLTVQVSAIGPSPRTKEVLLQPKAIAAEAALAVDAPVAIPNEVTIIAEPVTAVRVPTIVPVTESEPIDANAAKAEVATPQEDDPVAAKKPQFIFPGIMYDKENQLLTGHNQRGLIWLGFDYDIEQNVFYSTIKPWQKAFGYTTLFNNLAPVASIFIKTREVFFNYDERDWMICFWKGKYGITSGAEIGVYTKNPHIANHYDGAAPEDFLLIDLTVYKNGEYFFTLEPQKHWWRSGYIVETLTPTNKITVDSTITFKDQAMTDAFVAALDAKEDINDVLYTESGFSVRIHW